MAAKKKAPAAPAKTSNTQAILDAIANGPAAQQQTNTPSIPAIGVPGAITTGPDGKPAYIGYQPVQPAIGTPDQRQASPGGARPVSDRPEYGPQPVIPQYFEGDEFKPATASAEDIAQWQRQMASAGLLTGSYHLGVWDAATAAAYKDVLAYANSAGTDDNTAMRALMSTPPQEAPAKRAPLVVQHTNPDDLTAAFKDAFQTRYGRKATSAELAAAGQKFVSDYQAEETAAQQQAYNLEGQPATVGGSTAGAVTDVASPATAATVAADQVNPTEASAYDMLSTYQRALQFLTQPGQGAAA